MATSNTKDVFRAVVGRRIVGVYDDGTSEIAGRVYVLVLDDGTGLAFGTGNGSYWTVLADDVRRAVRRVRGDLKAAQANLKDVLALAGERTDD